MNYLICANCRSLTPPWRYCQYCNARLPKVALDGSAPAQVSMDPHLLRLAQRVQGQGIYQIATSSTKADETAVIARVTDADAFDALENVRVKTVIKPLPGDADDATIVTARLPLKEVEEIRKNSVVKSLKASQRMRPWLENTRAAAGLADDYGAEETNKPALGKAGAGVIIGIVDFGLDFQHRNFRNADGSSRILALWDQKNTDKKHCPARYGYGREYTKREINAALKTADPYQKLGYAPPPDSLSVPGAHGTYVADVAAGNGRGSQITGFAPKADIVFVDVATAPDANELGLSFGDSAQLLEAVDYIFNFAGDRPCVVNISLGTNGGPHDGSTLVELALDRLVSQAPNRAVVIAAGNSFGEDIHASGAVPTGGVVDLRWAIPKNDPTSNELELWYDKEDRFTVELLDPQKREVARVAPGGQWELAVNGHGLLTVVNRLHDSVNQDNLINVFFECGLPAGVWTLRLHGTEIKNGGQFHAWIERDESGQARFIRAQKRAYQIDDATTLSSLANGLKTIVVGAYDARPGKLKLGHGTSAGPTRNGRNKPELIAPGEQVLAAHSRTVVMRNRQSGTSMAAPAVTGAIALMLAEAQALGLTLEIETIRQILIETAQPFTKKANGWDARSGYGRVNAVAAVEAVRQLKP